MQTWALCLLRCMWQSRVERGVLRRDFLFRENQRRQRKSALPKTPPVIDQMPRLFMDGRAKNLLSAEYRRTASRSPALPSICVPLHAKALFPTSTSDCPPPFPPFHSTFCHTSYYGLEPQREERTAIYLSLIHI